METTQKPITRKLLGAALEASGLDNKLAAAIHESIRNIQEAGRGILRELESLDSTTARLRTALAEGRHINELGEFASTASKLDRLMILRQERISSHKALCRALPLTDEQHSLAFEFIGDLP